MWTLKGRAKSVHNSEPVHSSGHWTVDCGGQPEEQKTTFGTKNHCPQG